MKAVKRSMSNGASLWKLPRNARKSLKHLLATHTCDNELLKQVYGSTLEESGYPDNSWEVIVGWVCIGLVNTRKQHRTYTSRACWESFSRTTKRPTRASESPRSACSSSWAGVDSKGPGAWGMPGSSSNGLGGKPAGMTWSRLLELDVTIQHTWLHTSCSWQATMSNKAGRVAKAPSKLLLRK